MRFKDLIFDLNKAWHFFGNGYKASVTRIIENYYEVIIFKEEIPVYEATFGGVSGILEPHDVEQILSEIEKI